MDETRPGGCLSAGLDCRTCIEAAAGDVARICTTLKGRDVRDIFFRIFADPNCAPMVRAFEREYEENCVHRAGAGPAVAAFAIA